MKAPDPLFEYWLMALVLTFFGFLGQGVLTGAIRR